MPSFQQYTLNMGSTAGYVVALSTPATSVYLLARGECYVKTTNALVAPTAPTVSPAPSTGATAGYLHMQAGESVSFGTDAMFNGPYPALQDQISHLIVWAVSAGDLVINAH